MRLTVFSSLKEALFSLEKNQVLYSNSLFVANPLLVMFKGPPKNPESVALKLGKDSFTDGAVDASFVLLKSEFVNDFLDAIIDSFEANKESFGERFRDSVVSALKGVRVNKPFLAIKVSHNENDLSKEISEAISRAFDGVSFGKETKAYLNEMLSLLKKDVYQRVLPMVGLLDASGFGTEGVAASDGGGKGGESGEHDDYENYHEYGYEGDREEGEEGHPVSASTLEPKPFGGKNLFWFDFFEKRLSKSGHFWGDIWANSRLLLGVDSSGIKSFPVLDLLGKVVGGSISYKKLMDIINKVHNYLFSFKMELEETNTGAGLDVVLVPFESRTLPDDETKVISFLTFFKREVKDAYLSYDFVNVSEAIEFDLAVYEPEEILEYIDNYLQRSEIVGLIRVSDSPSIRGSEPPSGRKVELDITNNVIFSTAWDYKRYKSEESGDTSGPNQKSDRLEARLSSFNLHKAIGGKCVCYFHGSDVESFGFSVDDDSVKLDVVEEPGYFEVVSFRLWNAKHKKDSLSPSKGNSIDDLDQDIREAVLYGIENLLEVLEKEEERGNEGPTGVLEPLSSLIYFVSSLYRALESGGGEATVNLGHGEQLTLPGDPDLTLEVRGLREVLDGHHQEHEPGKSDKRDLITTERGKLFRSILMFNPEGGGALSHKKPKLENILNLFLENGLCFRSGDSVVRFYPSEYFDLNDYRGIFGLYKMILLNEIRKQVLADGGDGSLLFSNPIYRASLSTASLSLATLAMLSHEFIDKTHPAFRFSIIAIDIVVLELFRSLLKFLASGASSTPQVGSPKIEDLIKTMSSKDKKRSILYVENLLNSSFGLKFRVKNDITMVIHTLVSEDLSRDGEILSKEVNNSLPPKVSSVAFPIFVFPTSRSEVSIVFPTSRGDKEVEIFIS